MKRAIAVFIFACASHAANADFFNYAEWARMQPHSRTMYLAGVYDGYLGASSKGESQQWLHFSACTSDAKLSVGQLSENVLEFSRAKPALHTGPVLNALIAYLDAACSKPRN